MVADRDEKMEKNEKNETVFFSLYYLCLILCKTGGYPILGQNVCICCTLSVGLLIRISPIGDAADGTQKPRKKESPPRRAT